MNSNHEMWNRWCKAVDELHPLVEPIIERAIEARREMIVEDRLHPDEMDGLPFVVTRAEHGLLRSYTDRVLSTEYHGRPLRLIGFRVVIED